MSEQHLYALAIYSFTSWFAWILQTDLKKYQGEIGPAIVPILALASIAGRISTLVFFIRLFWVASFSWYTPILIAIVGEAVNLIVLTPLFALATRQRFFLMSLFDLISTLGIVVSPFVQSYFFRHIAS